MRVVLAHDEMAFHIDVPLDAEAEATGRLVRWPSINVLAYHFPMIADEGRNQAFDLALTQAVAHFKGAHGGTPPRVLDIGSGSGLLAMMAARAGWRYAGARFEKGAIVSPIALMVTDCL